MFKKNYFTFFKDIEILKVKEKIQMKWKTKVTCYLSKEQEV